MSSSTNTGAVAASYSGIVGGKLKLKRPAASSHSSQAAAAASHASRGFVLAAVTTHAALFTRTHSPALAHGVPLALSTTQPTRTGCRAAAQMAGDRLSGSKRKDSGAATDSSSAAASTAASRVLEGETHVVSGLSDVALPGGTIKAHASGKTPAQQAHEEVLARRVRCRGRAAASLALPIFCVHLTGRINRIAVYCGARCECRKRKRSQRWCPSPTARRLTK